MAKLFGVDLRQKFAQAFGPGKAKPATLIRIAPGVRTPGALTNGTNTTGTSYPCRGWIAGDVDHEMQFGTGSDRVKVKAKEIVILAGTLPAGVAPETGDSVTIDGTRYTVIALGSDSADAMYALVAR